SSLFRVVRKKLHSLAMTHEELELVQSFETTSRVVGSALLAARDLDDLDDRIDDAIERPLFEPSMIGAALTDLRVESKSFNVREEASYLANAFGLRNELLLERGFRLLNAVSEGINQISTVFELLYGGKVS